MKSKYEVGDIIHFKMHHRYEILEINLSNNTVRLKGTSTPYLDWYCLIKTNKMAVKVSKLEKALQ